MKCRHCSADLRHIFLDLGYAPPSNAYLSVEALQRPEMTFPLKLFVCEECWLVQTQDYVQAGELFSSDYAYFSSTSSTWLKHAADFVESVSSRLQLSPQSFVVEVASNDGYLLKNFVARGIPCLGVEPTDSTAEMSERIGVPVLRKFFGTETARELAAQGKSADLICGNNVYAHVPDINDFTSGLRIALKEGGTVTLEFPHLMRLVAEKQFDTVYHEHFSYLSLFTVDKIFSQANLRIFDVEALATHGGSLRVFGCHNADSRITESSVAAMLKKEESFGLRSLDIYLSFQGEADRIKNDFLMFLLEQKLAGKSVVAYGAAAKGNTLMNYAGVRRDMIEFVCDAAESKQGKFMPGSHIPIVAPRQLLERNPDWVVILPWNIASEVIEQNRSIQDRAKFIIFVPEKKIVG